MDLKIGREVENKLLERKEISFTISHKGETPTVDEVKVQICKKLNLNPDLTVVVNINALFGSSQSNVLVHSYATKDAMNIEKKHLFERASKKAAKIEKAEPAAQAAAPNEKKEEQEAKAKE